MVIKEVRSTEEFKRLKEEWNDLLKNAKSPTAFQTWEWLFTWWKYFGHGKDLLILLAFDKDGGLKGIAPFYVVEKRYLFKKSKVVEFIGYGSGKNSEYLDIMAGKERCEEVMRSFLLHLEEKIDWDVLHLTNLPEEGNTAGIVSSIADDYKRPVYPEENLSCPYIRLTEDTENMDQYLKTIKPKQRSRLRHEKNQLFRNYDVEVIRWGAQENLSEGVELSFKLHETRFGDRSVYNNKANRSFIADVSAALLESDILKLYFMKINGEYASVMYCLDFNNKIVFYQTGYDTKWLHTNAQKILIYSVIEESIASRRKEFDFGRGTEQYKLEWTKTLRRTQDLTLFRNRCLGRIFINERALNAKGKSVVKALLKKKIKT